MANGDFRKPSVIAWQRLEARPRSADFGRALRAQIHDPLWMLARQWQLGEFRGEDAGSPVLVQVATETSRLTEFAAGGQEPVPYEDRLLLEAQVEKEVVPMALRLRVQLGHKWLRLLGLRVGDKYAPLFRAAFPVAKPPRDFAHAEQHDDPELVSWRLAVARRAMDGGEFYASLLRGEPAENAENNGLSIADEDKAAVRQTAQEFMTSAARLFVQPAPEDENAWRAEQLEYQFSCWAPREDGAKTRLEAKEYYQGTLDWYAFDVAQESGDPTGAAPDRPANDVVRREALAFLPTAVLFPGMPKPRYWEIEEQRVDLGAISVDRTDLAKLLLLEFALVFGNDWSVVPYNVPVGGLCRVRGVVVTDVFGVRTRVRAADSDTDESARRWRVFGLSAHAPSGPADQQLLLAPTAVGRLDAPAIEKVMFARDEMANMVWAREHTFSDELGRGRDGAEAAHELDDLLRILSDTTDDPPSPATEAEIAYRVASSVPENWIPFVPARVSDDSPQIMLQRAAQLRLLPGVPRTPISPRGVVLRPPGTTDAPYFIREEEVPRAGAVVTRAFQRARGRNGETYVWLGRRKQTGRDNRASGLAFDQIIDHTGNDSI